MIAQGMQAVFRGGPADGRLMVVRDLREIRIQTLAEPLASRWDLSPEELLAPLPTITTTYLPARIVAEFTPGGLL